MDCFHVCTDFEFSLAKVVFFGFRINLYNDINLYNAID